MCHSDLLLLAVHVLCVCVGLCVSALALLWAELLK